MRATGCVITWHMSSHSKVMQEHAKTDLYFYSPPPPSKDTDYGSPTLMTSLSPSYLQG